MKIKLPNYNTLDLTQHNYYIFETTKEIRIMDLDNKFLLNKKAEYLLLPEKYHIELFLMPIKRFKATAGIILTQTPKQAK